MNGFRSFLYWIVQVCCFLRKLSCWCCPRFLAPVQCQGANLFRYIVSLIFETFDYNMFHSQFKTIDFCTSCSGVFSLGHYLWLIIDPHLWPVRLIKPNALLILSNTENYNSPKSPSLHHRYNIPPIEILKRIRLQHNIFFRTGPYFLLHSSLYTWLHVRA